MIVKKIKIIIALLLLCYTSNAQSIVLKDGWKFIQGDDMQYANPTFKDENWKPIDPTKMWEFQGYENYNGFGWYRIKFYLPSALKTKSLVNHSLLFFLAKVDDCDFTYVNGVKIGGDGRFKDDPNGYDTKWNNYRNYIIPINHPALKWDAENVLAVRVYDDNGGGGMWGAIPEIRVMNYIDFVQLDTRLYPMNLKESATQKNILLKNTYIKPISGNIKVTVSVNKKTVFEKQENVVIAANKSIVKSVSVPVYNNAQVAYTFTEKNSKATLSDFEEMPYILTPKEKPTVKINTPHVYGCSPNKPFQFLVTATGNRPISFSCSNLPNGLSINKNTGLITGTISNKGEYEITISAKNNLGTATKKLIIKANEKLCYTPPMGWNSWNCFGINVNQQKVATIAKAMVSSGLANHGWTYINIDDGWEASKRNNNGEIVCNNKFPNIKNLVQQIHSLGLKAGIYSSPGETTCGGFLGSYKYENNDAQTYANWGIDYLKYDWCGYANIISRFPTLQQLKDPYTLMGNALKQTNRDIVYSLCQQGRGNVWEWGPEVGGHTWRTTGDIEDTWESLKEIGFTQDTPAMYNKANFGFADPDMLIVGMVGWSGTLHNTRLTPTEQYTHISLWSLLGAPLLIGCDITKMDAFTYNLLSNDEVIEIDQDALGYGAKKYVVENNIQVWTKELADGNYAVGIFNLNDTEKNIAIDFSKLNMPIPKQLRDVWRQKNIPTSNTIQNNIAPHGVLLLKLFK